MKIFQHEKEAGIAEIISNNNSVAYCVQAESFGEEVKNIAFAKKLDVNTELFYPTKSILATTSWNQNDDIFGPEPTWAARKSPINTPTNIGHDHDEGVGHIIDTWVIDADNKLIADDTSVENLPDKFHLCNAAVIYKWPNSKSKKNIARAKKLIEEIESGEKFVSMECIFSDFDYAVISPENKHYLIARGEKTSFLTKHLRIYGGTGSYNDYKIGRFLKDMVFSGKGYVDNPANPESIIFDNEVAFASKEYKNDLLVVSNKKTFKVPVEIEYVIKNNTEKVMAEIDSTLQNENKELKTLVADLQKQLADAGVKKFEETIKTLTASVEEKSNESKEISSKLAEANNKIAELTKASEAFQKETNELKEEVAKANADKVRSTRISTLVEGGVDKAEAEKKVDKFANLSDEQFDEVASEFIAAVAAKNATPSDNKEVTEEVLDGAKPEDAVAGTISTEEEDNSEDDTAKLYASVATLMGFSGDNGDK